MSADIECATCGDWIDPSRHFHSIEEWEQKHYPRRCDHNEFWTCTTQREAGWILISCDICPAEWQEMLPPFGASTISNAIDEWERKQ